MGDKAWLNAVDGRTIDEVIELERDYRIDSLVVAIEGALLAKAQHNPTESIVVAVEAMEREVNNGGWEQFFRNSSHEHAPILVASLERIGAAKTAAVARRAIHALGASPDWRPGDYEAAVASASEPVLERLRECDSGYYELTEPVADKLFEFIKLNRAEIRI